MASLEDGSTAYQEPSIALVVLNWKDARRTRECVARSGRSELLQVVLVVDNESDGSLTESELRALTRVPVELIEVPENRGYAAGINLALASRWVRDAAYVLVINNDAAIEPASVRALVHYADRDPHLGILAPRLLNEDGTAQSSGVVINRLVGWVRELDTPGRLDFVTWACVLLRTDALRDVGLLDEGFFMYWEDVDYSIRLRSAGWGELLVPEATVRHQLAASNSRSPARMRGYLAGGACRMARKYGSAWWWNAAMVVARHVLVSAVRLDGAALAAVVHGVRLGLSGRTPAYESWQEVRVGRHP